MIYIFRKGATYLCSLHCHRLPLNIAEITARKEALQRKLEIFVHNELSNFQEENCVSISDVFFDFTTVQKLIEVHPRLVLTGVNIEIKI